MRTSAFIHTESKGNKVAHYTVWSEGNQLRGGVFCMKGDAKAIRSLVRDIEEDGVFEVVNLRDFLVNNTREVPRYTGADIVRQRRIVRNLRDASQDFLGTYATSQLYADLRNARETVSKLELAVLKLRKMEAESNS